MPNFEDDSGNCHAPDPNGVACYKSRIGCPIHPKQKRKAMSNDDKISEIKERHFHDERWRNGPSMLCPQMHEDRATLLAEDARHRAENELQRAEIELQRTSRHREARAFEAEHNRLQAALNTARRERDEARAEDERHRAEIERLRATLGGIRIDGPDADGLVWATIQHPAIAVRSHVMVGNVNRMVSQAFMDFEEMRRKALEGKP